MTAETYASKVARTRSYLRDTSYQIVIEADEEIARLRAALLACREAAETLRVRHEGEAEDFRASVIDAPSDDEAERRRTSAEQHWCAENACLEIVKFIDDKMTSLGVEMQADPT